jgi:hypothetical protein
MDKPMIDYSTLATDTITTLQPFLELGGKEMLKSVAKDLWIKVKSLFTNNEEEKIINNLENNPLDLKNQGKIEMLLETKLKDDQELLMTITKLLEDVKKTEDYSSIITQKGNDNISISGKITNSNVNINK